MRLFGKETADRPIIIAEVGANHEGSADKAEDLILMAHQAGADAVKLQSWTAERFVSAQDPERLERVRTFGLSRADHDRLFGLAAARGIALFSTAVSEDWVSVLFDLAPAIKIASGDLTFDPMLEAVATCAAATGKPVILSTGMATVAEIDHAVGIFRRKFGDRSGELLALMHCVSGYPTPLREANLRAIPFLKDRYGLTTGWSNHVTGAAACIAAAALGADLVEVHVTDSREGKTFRDHHLSMNAEELGNLVETIRDLAQGGLGAFDKPVAGAERDNRVAARKGVIAARDLPEGQALTEADLRFARPASEFSANEIGRLIGASLTQAVPGGHLIPRAAVTGLGEDQGQ